MFFTINFYLIFIYLLILFIKIITLILNCYGITLLPLIAIKLAVKFIFIIKKIRITNINRLWLINLKYLFNFSISFNSITPFFLMFCHIPFWNILFTTIFADKRSYPLMLPNMNFKIWSCIIFFFASFKWTIKFINI